MRRGPLEQAQAESLDGFFHQASLSLFQDHGILAPVPELISDDTLAPGSVVVELNGRSLGTIQLVAGVNPVGVIGLLEQNAGELVVPAFVEFFLVKLQSRFPVLVETVRKRLSIGKLCDALRSRVERGESIKNLPGVLEDILAESL